MIEVHSRTVRIADRELLAEASLNNCSSLWAATVRDGDRLVATAAGTGPEDALNNAIERAQRALVPESEARA
jgi:hypothetical protein